MKILWMKYANVYLTVGLFSESVNGSRLTVYVWVCVWLWLYVCECDGQWRIKDFIWGGGIGGSSLPRHRFGTASVCALSIVTQTMGVGGGG